MITPSFHPNIDPQKICIGDHWSAGQRLSDLIARLAPYPVVALTRKENEHRGIAAVRAGAQGYICVDDVTVATQEGGGAAASMEMRLR